MKPRDRLHRRLLRTALALVLAVLTGGCGADIGLWGLSDGTRVPTRPPNAGDNTSDSTIDDADDASADLPSCVGGTGTYGAEQADMFAQINAYRRQNGLVELTYSGNLEDAGYDYARRMWREDFFDHVAPDGSAPADRAEAAGFCHRYVGENIAYGLNGVTTATAAMSGFKNSPPHNENLLNPNWRFVGVGYLRIDGFLGDEYWWVQMFAAEVTD